MAKKHHSLIWFCKTIPPKLNHLKILRRIREDLGHFIGINNSSCDVKFLLNLEIDQKALHIFFIEQVDLSITYPSLDTKNKSRTSSN